MKPVAVLYTALSLGALVAVEARAQAIQCNFTAVCAPQIGCEAHDGIPFDLSMTETGAEFERDGAPLAGVPLTSVENAPLGLLFDDGAGRLLFTLTADGAAALTEHRQVASGRIETSTFTGQCEVQG